ncbi:hypothetical protein FIBSPDRAFT_720172 [Athelia psychrophila]|uniref:Uncharacterized protein n=1 Tax=Athelia psychrophila TaxID=1759441 RepID=A0A166WHU1_9AGAM|nr:hypothetical protein FIBSPDRAFT_720172 [Fibularhizoctonia sp. CBS 109695]
MIDWKAPEEVVRDGEAFAKFMHVLLGLYIWEFVTSLDFDWQFISGRKTFRWPLASPTFPAEHGYIANILFQVFYFAGRYMLLFALIGIAIALNVIAEIDCQALYTVNQLFGNASIGLASINLSLRTMAVWSQKWYIVVPLIAIIMGQWSLLMHGVLLTAEWVPGEGCAIVSTDSHILAISFMYTMLFDLVVLCLTGWKLLFPANSRSRLVTLIFTDGLIFFFIAFLSNLLATIFMLMDLNGVMSIIANVPAAIASTIVACRAVRRLANFSSSSPELFAHTTHVPSLAFRSQDRSPVIGSKPGSPTDGVHVQMETFQSMDRSFEALPSTGHEKKLQMVEMDSEKASEMTCDLESQVTAKDFQGPPY